MQQIIPTLTTIRVKAIKVVDLLIQIATSELIIGTALLIKRNVLVVIM